MARALQLARKGLYSTHPNPRVGCVIVADGELVGEGWHVRAGEPHAEVHALRQAGERARGATAYVTLEPCSHYGRTPPCAEALVRAGVGRVVAAVQDPNPQVAGNGLALLRSAGIEVASGVLEAEARELNCGFIKRMESGLPFVRAKLAMSLDGRTAMASGESQWITGPAARAEVQRLRARSSVVLTGADTVLMDVARLTVRGAELGLDAETTALALQRPPLRVLVDGRLRVQLEAPFFQAGPALVATAVPGCEEAYRAAGYEALVLGQERVDRAAAGTGRARGQRGAGRGRTAAGRRVRQPRPDRRIPGVHGGQVSRLLGAAAAGASARSHERGARAEDRRHPCGG